MPKRITNEQRAECIRLRQRENLSTPQIARRVGICNQSVYRTLQKYPWAPVHPRRAWPDSDHERLRRLWPRASRQAILEAFAPRRWEAISKMASFLKIRRSASTRWTRKRSPHPICARLRQIREERDLTRPQLGAKMGYHRQQLTCWELGIQTGPSLRQLEDWCAALGMRLELVPVASTATFDSIAAPTKAQLMSGRVGSSGNKVAA